MIFIIIKLKTLKTHVKNVAKLGGYRSLSLFFDSLKIKTMKGITIAVQLPNIIFSQLFLYKYLTKANS